MHASRLPSSRHYAAFKGKIKPREKLLKAFQKDPKPPHAAPGVALFDLRKRLSRAISHGDNIHAHLLASFALVPVRGFWVLQDTPAGTWMVTHPKKGSVKFCHDDFDPYGRLKTVGLRPIEALMKEHQEYVALLQHANRFAAGFVEDFCSGPAGQGPAANRLWAKPEVSSPEDRAFLDEVKKQSAMRKYTAKKKEKERLLREAKEPVVKGLGKERFEAWCRRKAEGVKATPPLTLEERTSMIERTRKLLVSSSTPKQQKPGWFESLEIRIHEKSV